MSAAAVLMATCPTCGRLVPDQAAHEALMTARRAKYGAGWGLDGLQAGYNPLDDDDNVETEPVLPYTRAAYR
jgi:hypothetical protein